MTPIATAPVADPPVWADQTEADSNVAVVQDFLLARDRGDFAVAAGHCASLMQLQDIDESWFVDSEITSEWLRQLVGAYIIDTLEPPQAEGNGVTWTERLTSRGAPDSGPSRVTVKVHAVLQDGKIAYLSGPYPPLPLRSLSVPPGGPAYVEHSNGARTVPPVVLFLSAAAGLALTAWLMTRVSGLLGRHTNRKTCRRDC